MATTMELVARNSKVERSERDSDGFWAYLKTGWRCISSGAHACREDSATRLLQSVKDSERCKCVECAPCADCGGCVRCDTNPYDKSP